METKHIALPFPNQSRAWCNEALRDTDQEATVGMMIEAAKAGLLEKHGVRLCSQCVDAVSDLLRRAS